MWVSTCSECSRRWQGNPFYVTVILNTCWRRPPAWVCCNISSSKSTLEMSIWAVHLSLSIPDLHLEWETTFSLEGCNKIQQTFEKEKLIVGILGGIFPATDQLHHLIGLNPGRHLLGQQICSSKPFNTTALQDKASEYSPPFKTQMCVSISLFTSTSWGTFETLLVGKETRNISCMKLQSTNQCVSINEPGFHTLYCLYSAGKQFSIKANWSNALYFFFKQYYRFLPQ